MLVHLVDGTYELFRHFYAVPPEKNADGLEVAAIHGVLGSMLYLLGDGATHLAVATDHVIESFRNDLWPGYKTGAGVDEALLAQFHPRARQMRDEAAIVAKFGVPPASIPDYLALVGDSADGYPGLPGWGAKSAAAVLAKYGSIEAIPNAAWDIDVR